MIRLIDGILKILMLGVISINNKKESIIMIKHLKNKQNLTLICSLVLIFTLMFATCVFASTDPGVDLGNWIQRNVAGVFIGVLAVIGVILLIKRQLMMVIVVLLFAGLGSVFVFGGQGFAQKLQTIISAWF